MTPENHTLALDEYRDIVALDDPFEAPAPASELERRVIVRDWLDLLRDDLVLRCGGVKVQSARSEYDQDRAQLSSLLTVRPPAPFPEAASIDLDRLLQAESKDRGVAHPAPRLTTAPLSTSLNIIKRDGNRKLGVASSRKRAGWDRNYLIELLTTAEG